MAVLKQTSPTAWPVAPKPKPSNTVPSASTSNALAFSSAQDALAASCAEGAAAGCFSSIEGLSLECAAGIHSASPDSGATLREAIAVLRDEINTALKGAMKARDERRVSTLRLINAALKNADFEAQGRAKPVLSDEEILALLQKLIKQRQEAVELYDKAGRAELAAREREEIEIISAYLPKQMSEAEAKAAVAEAIKATGATSMKDMGKVMAALKQGYAGKIDVGRASGWVKELLAG